MPRLTSALPKYRKHRGSGQAVVNLGGVDCYLGPHGTRASKLAYDRLVAEWLQNGRRLTEVREDAITIMELIAAYLNYARGYYRKGGRLTSEYAGIRASLRCLKLYVDQPAGEFGPLSLQTVRQRLVDEGKSRGVVNQSIGRVKRMFKWAAGEELISASIPQALSMVSGLRRGRTEARETAPVLPVDDAVVDATLPYLPETVADMVRLQRLTGMRPGEVCRVRPCYVDRGEDIWIFQVPSHKTEHHDVDRKVFLGPKAQAVLQKYLARDSRAACFQPAESERQRREAQRAARVTPLGQGNRPGTNRTRKPKRPPGETYTTETYGKAIARACAKAFPHPMLRKIPRRELTTEQAVELAVWMAEHGWSPNRLRHAAATEIRRRFDLDAAGAVLGHSHLDVTQVYALRDAEKAKEVARALG